MSIDQTLRITVLSFSLFLAGCGKPEISADCNVNGLGNAHCVFHNKGSGKGSTCVNIALSDLAAGSSPSSNLSAIALQLSTFQLAKKIPVDVDVGAFLFALSFSPTMENIAPDTSFEDYVKTNNYLSEFTKLSAQQRIAAKQTFEKLKKISIEHPHSQVSHIRFSDSALCSGNLDAGDVAERNAVTSFEGLQPTAACRKWPDSCTMTTVYVNDLAKTKESLLTEDKWIENVNKQILQAFSVSP